jgi:hypothetical protein
MGPLFQANAATSGRLAGGRYLQIDRFLLPPAGHRPRRRQRAFLLFVKTHRRPQRQEWRRLKLASDGAAAVVGGACHRVPERHPARTGAAARWQIQKSRSLSGAPIGTRLTRPTSISWPAGWAASSSCGRHQRREQWRPRLIESSRTDASPPPPAHTCTHTHAHTNELGGASRPHVGGRPAQPPPPRRRRHCQPIDTTDFECSIAATLALCRRRESTSQPASATCELNCRERVAGAPRFASRGEVCGPQTSGYPPPLELFPFVGLLLLLLRVPAPRAGRTRAHKNNYFVFLRPTLRGPSY